MSDSLHAALRHFVSAQRRDPAFRSLRLVQRHSLDCGVTRDQVDPVRHGLDQGAMLCAEVDGVEAFAATSDLGENGLRQAFERARQLAASIAARALPRPAQAGADLGQQRRSSPHFAAPLPDLAQWLDLLRAECAAVPRGERIVDWSARLGVVRERQLYLDRHGSDLLHETQRLYPWLSVTAFDGQQSQTRTFEVARQGGAEVMLHSGFAGAAARVADEALQLLLAPNTPEGTRDLLLMPDQMILQIHESIGHPLELDRILGDERNYAGTSFVTADMFGHYQYGSPLLNVSFAPDVPDELASYAYDDEGTPAERQLLIANGILQRPLGGALSQARSQLAGVANSRACNWNRAPIDRMANLNVEPGDKSLAQLIGGIEKGILMATNRSWSIDDARNKFQFGCEWGQLIDNGELAGVVRNPNYRGISAQFWRSLGAVGDASTFSVMGTANCGKGEPNQAITVGHASPACVFKGVTVFGGQA